MLSVLLRWPVFKSVFAKGKVIPDYQLPSAVHGIRQNGVFIFINVRESSKSLLPLRSLIKLQDIVEIRITFAGINQSSRHKSVKIPGAMIQMINVSAGHSSGDGFDEHARISAEHDMHSS